MSPSPSFPLDGVMVRPLPSKYPRAVYRVTNPLKPSIFIDVTIALDLADPEARLVDVIRSVVTAEVLKAANTEPTWKLALADLVRPQ